LTVTATRERTVDFNTPFYVTGLGIAVPAGEDASWLPIVHTLTSFGFIQAIAVLIGLAVVVGLVVWFLERRYNKHFGGGVARGLGTGVWWSAMAMTQRHTGDIAPRTHAGRIVGSYG
jgi:polar amino acid transport system substrate-binding protein